MIVCRGRSARARCAFCDRWHTRLCDAPAGNGRTCDLKLCDEHAAKKPDGRDLCRYHSGQLELAIPAVAK